MKHLFLAFIFIFSIQNSYLLSSHELTSSNKLKNIYDNDFSVEEAFKKDFMNIINDKSRANLITLDERYIDYNVPLLLAAYADLFKEQAQKKRHTQALEYLSQNGVYIEDKKKSYTPDGFILPEDWRWEHELSSKDSNCSIH